MVSPDSCTGTGQPDMQPTQCSQVYQIVTTKLFYQKSNDLLPSTTPVSLLGAPQPMFLSPCSQPTHLEVLLHQGCPYFNPHPHKTRYSSLPTTLPQVHHPRDWSPFSPASSGRLAAQVDGIQSHREPSPLLISHSRNLTRQAVCLTLFPKSSPIGGATPCADLTGLQVARS